jgi:hypothetical protein
MKKQLFIFTIIFVSIFLFGVSAKAQLKKPGIELGGNFIYGTPKGKFADAYNFGVGGELYGGVGLGSTYLIATIGITGYKAQSQNEAGTMVSRPVTLGLKKYFLLKKLFINADAGASSVKVSNTTYSGFTGGVGAGVRLLGLEAGLYYNTFKNPFSNGYNNSLNAKIGFGFSL